MTKLFAVVALGACEMADAPPPQPPHNAAAVVPAPEPATTPTATDETAPVNAAPAAAPPQAAQRPRTLRNGRPACGNVQSRKASPCEDK